MLRRLLERFEQRVERAKGEHVDFVDEENFVGSAGGSVLGFLTQVADVLHAVVARSVDFENVEAVALRDFFAGVANSAGIGRGAFLAVQRFGEDAGGRGFADAARPDEQIGLREAVGPDGVLQGAGDMLLPHDLRKGLGAVFSGKDAVTHNAGEITQSRLPGTIEIRR